MSSLGILLLVLWGAFVATITQLLLVLRLRRRNYGRSSIGIATRLVDTGGPVTIELKRGIDNCWNPVRSDTWGVQHVRGPGTARYSLTADHAVSLVLTRPGGNTTTYVGPLPVLADDAATRGGARLVQRLTRVAAGLYAGGACLGAVAGYLIANGSSSGTRALAALLGAIVGFALARFLLRAALLSPPIARRLDTRLQEGAPTQSEADH